jgi:hypothetical protein
LYLLATNNVPVRCIAQNPDPRSSQEDEVVGDRRVIFGQHLQCGQGEQQSGNVYPCSHDKSLLRLAAGFQHGDWVPEPHRPWKTRCRGSIVNASHSWYLSISSNLQGTQELLLVGSTGWVQYSI